MSVTDSGGPQLPEYRGIDQSVFDDDQAVMAIDPRLGRRDHPYPLLYELAARIVQLERAAAPAE